MNKVILIGRLTKAPEATQTHTGKSVAKFTLAVDRTKENTDFLPVICYDKLAELISQYTTKGSQIAVWGSIQTRSYDATDGTKRYVTEIIANEVRFLSRKEEHEQHDQSKPVEPEKPERIHELKPLYDEDLPF